MGADFIHSACPLPPEITDQIKRKISFRISNLNRATVDSILEIYHHDWEAEVNERIDNKFGEEHLFKLHNIRYTLKKEIAQELIKDALEEVIYSNNRRDIGHMFLDHKWWLISGGMSYGDEPTEAMRYIDIIEESKILKGLNIEK